MSATISMWLGIAFLGLAVVATLLQAWLWSFPMAPDPGGPDPNGRSTAPRSWTHVHRAMGLAYLAIYVAMMVEMVPRLWEYQFELPARTVMHAVMGITIGVLLAAKIAIIRWFQHFGKALPTIGLTLLLCTVILSTLSLPFALRAHDVGGQTLDPQNLARVRRILTGLDFGHAVDGDALTTRASMEAGRDVLARKCTVCHDIRTIIIKPRTGAAWLDSVQRMAQKPAIGEPITEPDIAVVTAYLVAITPDIQESTKRKQRQERQREERAAEVAALPSPEPPPAFDPVKVRPVYEDKCSQCHELTEVTAAGGKDEAGWAAIVRRMVEDNGAELSENEARDITLYLAASFGKP